LVSVLVMLVLTGCLPEDEGPGQPGAEKSSQGFEIHPAPIPAVVDSPEREPQGDSVFFSRLQFVDPDRTTIVKGRVEALTALERSLPLSVWPEEGDSIVTEVRFSVADILCGPPVEEMVDVTYVGGTLGDQWMRTSLMVNDLSKDQEYVLILTHEDGEFFLVGGNNEVLVPDAVNSELFRDANGRQLRLPTILEGCR